MNTVKLWLVYSKWGNHMACELYFIIVYFLNIYFYTYILIYILIILVTEKIYIQFTEESKKNTHNTKKENNILYFILK